MVKCSCGFLNPDDVKYCQECGDKLYVKVPRRVLKQRRIKDEIPDDNNIVSQYQGAETVGHGIENPMIYVSFYEAMPGRLNLDQNKDYISGILEIGDKEIIIHKKSFWRGKDRGKKHIRYDKMTSIDFDTGRFLSLPAIQVYLTSIEYSFRSKDERLESFYDMIREKIDEVQVRSTPNNSHSPLDELRKLAELRDMGVVTEEEFELKKKRLLNSD